MRRLALFLLILIVAAPVFCAVSYTPKAEARVGAEFYHSKLVSETIPFRTSLNVSGDIVPLAFRSGSFSFGAGLSLSYTTRSLAFGQSITKPYKAIGPVVDFSLQMTKVFSLGVKARLMFCKMGPAYVDEFASVEAELEPAFCILSRNRFSLNVLVPLTAVFRKDGYCLRAGAGIGIVL